MKIFNWLRQLTELFDMFLQVAEEAEEKSEVLKNRYRQEYEDISAGIEKIYDDAARNILEQKEYTENRLAGDLSLTEYYTDMIRGRHWKKQKDRYYIRAEDIQSDIEYMDTDYLLEYIRRNMEKIHTTADKLNNSFVPPALSGFVGMFNKNYRKKDFARIAVAKENILQAAQMICNTDNTEKLLTETEKEKAVLLDMAYRQYKEKIQPLDGELEQTLTENNNDLNRGIKIFSDVGLFKTDGIYMGDYHYGDEKIVNSLYDKNLFIADRIEVNFPAFRQTFKENIFLTKDENTDLNICFTSFITDILQSAPESKIYVADVEGIGGNYLYLVPLLNTGRVEVWKTGGEVARGLNCTAEFIADINSGKICRNEKSIYIFFDNIDKNIPENCFEELLRICENGKRAGVYTILAKSRKAGFKRDGAKVAEKISQIGYEIKICDYEIPFSEKGRLVLPMTVDTLKIERLCQRLLKRKKKKSVLEIGGYLPTSDEFQKSDSTDGISLHIGKDENGKDIYLNINESKPYCLITGDVDTGKSSVLHCIILQSLLNYPPNQVQLAVGDFKEGAEFNIYAKSRIQAVQSVVNNQDVDVMASFLRYYLKEAGRRQHIFEEMAEKSGKLVRKYETYRAVRKKFGGEEMPRILLIIDEYQSLFNNSPVTAELMSELVRNGRTYGIHIIMASQRAVSDSAKNYFSTDLKNYFTHRFVFRSPRQAAGAMLSMHCSDTGRENTGIAKASLLEKGRAVYNSYMGQNEKDNSVIQCFYADDKVIDTACELLNVVNGKGNSLLLRKNEPSPVKNTGCDSKLEIGISPCMYRDYMTDSRDVIVDKGDVYISPFNENILVRGRDDRLILSVIGSAARYISAKAKGEVNVFRSENHLAIEKTTGVNLLITKEEQTDVLEYQLNNKTEDINVFIDIDEEYISDRSREGELLAKVMKRKNALFIIGCANYRKLRSSFIPGMIAINIAGVGDMENVRQCMGESFRLTPSDFDVPNKKSIKAYYCNKHTDKWGKIILYSEKQDFL